MNDEEKLEAVTSCLMHGLFHYRLSDPEKYEILKRRAIALIEAEQSWREQREQDSILLHAWGAQRN